MNAPGDNPAVRRTALMLHAMHPADRAWVLGELPVAQRAVLDPLVAELQDLGIPADATLLSEVVDTGADTTAGSPRDEPTHSLGAGHAHEERLLRLTDSEVSKLAQALAVDSPALAAQLLTACDWSWRERLLAQLETPLRGRIESLAVAHHGRTVPEGLRSAILECTVEVLDTAVGAQSVGDRASVTGRSPAPYFVHALRGLRSAVRRLHVHVRHRISGAREAV